MPVLIQAVDRYSGDSALTRVKDSLWPSGQRVLEALPPVLYSVATEEKSQISFISNSPSVQIVMRTKDREFLLYRALRSVFNQTYKNFVLTIINDGGDVAGVERAASIFPYDTKIKIIHNPESLGMEAASNKAISSEDTDLIVIHDDDDSWHPNFLEKSIKFYVENKGKYSAVVSKTVLVTEEISNKKVRILNKEPYQSWVERIDLTDLATNNLFAPIAFVFERHVYKKIGGYDESFKVLGDWDFNLRYCCVSSIGVAPEFLAYYHQRPSIKSGAAANSIHGGRDLHSEYLGVLRQKYLRNSDKDDFSRTIFNALMIGVMRAEISATRGTIAQSNEAANVNKLNINASEKKVKFYHDLAIQHWVLCHALKGAIQKIIEEKKIDASVLDYWRKDLDAVYVEMRRSEFSKVNLPSSIPSFFEELNYLSFHDDVPEIVRKGDISSGFEHYLKYGLAENRRLS